MPTTKLVTYSSGAPQSVRPAADALRKGQLVAFPTETVFGLGVDALNFNGVKSLYAVKNRPSSLPLALHLSRVGDIPRWVQAIPGWAEALITAFMPGPLMVLLPKNDRVPDYLTSGSSKVGIRVPANTSARILLEEAGVLVAATSANLHAQNAPANAAEVLAVFKGKIAIVLEAEEQTLGIASTVLDITVYPPRLLRQGAITPEDLLAYVPLDTGR